MALMDGHGIVNLGQYGAGALGLAGMAPGVPGMVATGLGALGTINNLGAVEHLRGELGIPGLNAGQIAGSFVGIPGASGNNYGTLGGNNTIANPQQFRNPMNGQPTAVTTGGIYDSGSFVDRALAQLGGMFGLGTGFANPLGAFTPAEAMTRNAFAKLPPGFFPKGGNPLTGGVTGFGTGSQAAVAAGTQAPSVVATSPKVGITQGIPITRADGTVVGFMNADGAGSTPAAQAAINSGAFAGGTALGIDGTPNGPATTAAMGGGFNGSNSLGGGIGNSTGINGGGQADRAGF